MEYNDSERVMMPSRQFERSERLLGPSSTELLASSSVAIFGLGGVGSFACEALVRAGIGRLLLVDADIVDETNLNRQLIALHSTIGLEKVEVMRARALDINPHARIDTQRVFVTPENAVGFDFSGYSFVIDCVDTVSAKLSIIERARAQGIPVISSMGTGNKIDGSRLEIADISSTSVCPLARVMRRELRKRRIGNVPALFSREEPRGYHATEALGVTGTIDETHASAEGCETGSNEMAASEKVPPGSNSFVPSVAGLLIAGYVIRAILGIKGPKTGSVR